MPSLRFTQVDVFTSVPFMGNPVAVVLEAEGLSSEQMQRIANWTNLSETTFVLPANAAGADYRVRIFTPHAELPFAGHPTIGTAHALLEAGLVAASDGKLVQQCQAGLIDLHVAHDTQDGNAERWIAFDLPPPSIRKLDVSAAAALQRVLDAPLASIAPPCLVDVGPRWVVAQLPDAQAVLAARPDLARLRDHDTTHGYTGLVLFGAYPDPGHGPAIEVRAFAPAHGVAEDPVCGSGNGCVAAYLRETGQVARFGPSILAAQGAALGRAGRLRLSIEDAMIRVAGAAVTCIDGQLRL